MNPPRRHGPVTRLFHWVTALGVLVMLPVGIAMTSEPLADIADPLFILHKGLGSVLLVVVTLRVLWRVMHTPAPEPDAVPGLQTRIMGRTHVTLYVLLVVMVVSGYVRTVGDGFPIELLDAMGIPTLLPRMPDVAQVMLVVHQVTAYTLVGVLGVHIGAAVHDRLFDRKGVWERMWPPIGGRRGR